MLSDEALAAGPAADHGDAFAELYRRYERPVLAYFARRTAAGELAVDLTAETFAAALASLRRGRGPNGLFAPWLFTIARNKLADSLRAGRVEDDARRALALQPVEVTDEAAQAIARLDAGAEIDAMLSALPSDQRDAVRARVLDERDYGAIAAELCCSELVVRKRVSRGLATLRGQMEEGGAR